MSYTTEDFYKYIAPDVNGVSIPIVADTVADTIIHFCRKTSFWRLWLEDHIAVYIDDEQVPLDLPEGTQVVNIIAIQVVENDGTYSSFIDPNTYTYSKRIDEPGIVFTEPSNEDYEARVRVALRPIEGFSEVPDWLYEDWRDTISCGAKHRLLSMRSQSWYSPVEAEQNRLFYQAGVTSASAKVVLETINKIHKPKSRYI